MTKLDKFKMGRNYVRIGDHVKVKPSSKGKRDGFKARVLMIRADDAGMVEYIDVAAPNGNLRTLPVARIQRVAQSRQDF